MGYPPRQYHEGYWYHVYARSPQPREMFVDAKQRLRFLHMLDVRLVRHGHTLGAFCLMDTHYHALIRMGPVDLDQALQSLHMTFAKEKNKAHGTRGQWFEDRPGADIVLNDTYLLQLVPYIHLNPVHAGIVSAASEYRWSSDGLYRTGSWEGPDLKSWGFPPNFLGKDRVRVYQQRLGEPVDPWPEGEVYVGTTEEWENLERRQDERTGGKYQERRDRPTKEEIARACAKNHDTSVEAMKNSGRKEPALSARQEAMVKMYEAGYGPTEIGRFFNRSKGTVWHAVKTRNVD